MGRNATAGFGLVMHCIYIYFTYFRLYQVNLALRSRR